MPIVDVYGLTKLYPGLHRPAVNDLSLQLDGGDILGFVGPNGAGKTTTLKMLLNLVIPDKGGGTIFGCDIVRDSVAIRKRTGFMSGEVRLYNTMRGSELLRFINSLHGGGDAARMDDLCRTFDVPLKRRIKTYSSGQKQMLALIAALSHKSDLLMLDEPTKGLDPSKKKEFLQLIAEWSSGGGSVIISSHVLSEIESICTRVVFIREGLLLDENEVRKAREKLSNLLIATFEPGVTEEQLDFEGITSVERRGNEFMMLFTGDGRRIVKQLADLPLTSLRFGAASLDDLYEDIYLDEDATETT